MTGDKIIIWSIAYVYVYLLVYAVKWVYTSLRTGNEFVKKYVNFLVFKRL